MTNRANGFSLVQLMIVIIIITMALALALKTLRNQQADSQVIATASEYAMLLEKSVAYRDDNKTLPPTGNHWQWLQDAGYLPSNYLTPSAEIFNSWKRPFTLTLSDDKTLMISSQAPNAEIAKQLSTLIPNGYVTDTLTVNSFIAKGKQPYMKFLTEESIPVYLSSTPFVTVVRDNCPSGYEPQIQAAMVSFSGSSITPTPSQIPGTSCSNKQGGGYCNNYRLESSWWGHDTHSASGIPPRDLTNFGPTFLVQPQVNYIQTYEQVRSNNLSKDGSPYILNNNQVAHNIYLGLQLPILKNISRPNYDHTMALAPLLMDGSYQGKTYDMEHGDPLSDNHKARTKLTITTDSNLKDDKAYAYWNTLPVWLFNMIKGSTYEKQNIDLSSDPLNNFLAYVLRYRVFSGFNKVSDCAMGNHMANLTHCDNLPKTPWLMNQAGDYPTLNSAHNNYQWPFFGMLTVTTWCQQTSGELYPQYVS